MLMREFVVVLFVVQVSVAVVETRASFASTTLGVSILIASSKFTWKRYVSCVLSVYENHPGYSDWNEIQQIQQYKDAMNVSCELTDACMCEYRLLTNGQTQTMTMSQPLNYGSYMNNRMPLAYKSCLHNSIMSACDDFTSPQQLLSQAEHFTNQQTSKENCQGNFDHPSCWSITNYVDCVESVGQGAVPLEHTEAENLRQALNSTEYCEISLSDTCLCQIDFVTSTLKWEDSCTASANYLSCVENSYMTGCNYVSREVVLQSAEQYNRQYCEEDTASLCSGTDMCHVDMSALSTETPESVQTSRTIMSDYIRCLQTWVSPECKSAASAVSMIQKLLDGKYQTDKVKTEPFIQDPCDVNGCPQIHLVTELPAYLPEYPDMLTKYPNQYPDPYPEYLLPPYTHPVDYHHGNKDSLLAAFIEDAKLEAKETVHEAEETLGALEDTANLAMG